MNLYDKKKDKNQVGVQFVITTKSSKSETSGPLITALESLSVDDNSDILTTIDEVHCAVLLEALEVREYITPEGKVSQWAKALELVNTEFQEESLLVIELLRTGYLNGNKLSIVSSQLENYENEREISLLTRIFSILPAQTLERSWEGPVDHDLMGFNSIVKAVYRSLRNLIEMLLLRLFLKRKSKLPPKEYIGLTMKLPFFQETNTALGIALKSLLSGTDPKKLPQQFPTCTHIIPNLKTAIKFWSEILKMIIFLKDQNMINTDLAGQFESANKLLIAKTAALY